MTRPRGSEFDPDQREVEETMREMGCTREEAVMLLGWEAGFDMDDVVESSEEPRHT